MKSPRVNLGKRMRKLRMALNLSQEELADITGLHRTYIGAVERGERNIGFDNILRIAKSLEVTASDLLQGVDN